MSKITFKLDEYEITTIDVIRTQRRKTVSIIIKEGAVSIRVPKKTSPEEISKMLHNKRRWMRQKLQNSLKQRLPRKQYLDGENFLYLGNNYSLICSKGDMPQVKIENGFLQSSIDKTSHLQESKQIHKSQIEQWYKNIADKILKGKTFSYSNHLNLRPVSIKTKSYKTRWGSCSPQGVISYNWKLIGAPTKVIDYVIVHELCHLKHLNHSKNFWDTLNQFMPNYKTHRAWLNNHGHCLKQF